MDSFYYREELEKMGFYSIGENVLISRKASFYSASRMSIGNNVRIDDFSVLSGNIKIGSYVHISAFVALYGSNGITINDYSGVSAHSIIYSAVDDFSGEYMIGPLYPKSVTNVQGGLVTLGCYTQIGASCVVMPNLIIAEGTVVGAMSFVNESLEPWGIYAGIPVKKIKDRSKRLLQLKF